LDIGKLIRYVEILHKGLFEELFEVPSGDGYIRIKGIKRGARWGGVE